MQFKWLQRVAATSVVFFTIQCRDVTYNVSNAQIIPDATLPIQSTVQRQNNTIKIEGGTRAGSNLFHSFTDFSVPNNSTAFFNNSIDVQNILTRVTGSARSDINGIIKANGFANLFLINPNGIIFGQNARLDIRGSFIGSTANAIGFGKSGNFSATNPEAPSPLLTINPSALLFNQIQTSSIESSSIAPDGRNPSNTFTARGLRVEDGKSLLLVGGDVSVNGGGLYAFGGRVELGGSSGIGTVGLNGDNGNFSLSFPSGIQRSDITLSNNALINVRAGNDGSIGVNARNLEMTENSQVLAGIESRLGSNNSKAGSIDINATGTVSLQEGSFIFNNVRQNALGQGGDVNIRTDTLRLTTGSQISANTYSSGQGGNLNINATSKIELIGANAINSNPSGLFVRQNTENATGNAGSLIINTPLLQVLNGATVSTSTSGAGRGGDLKIDAGRIEVIGILNNGSGSSITAQANSNAIGAAGNLIIKTDDLIARDGGFVSASTFGAGRGGDLKIDASRIEIIGTSSDGSASKIATQANSNATGKAGNLTIKTNQLLAQDGGQVSASTFGAGEGGDLKIDATSKIELIGVNAINSNPSGLFAQQDTEDATGNARSLTINTPLLRVLDGANVSASTSGIGTGGDLKIDAGTIEVIGTSSNGSDSSIIAEAYSTATGKAGDLTINTNELLVRDGAQVSAGTFGAGKGGNLTVNASEKVEVTGTEADGKSSSRLAANTSGIGNAGNLTINTLALVVNNAQVGTTTFGKGDAGTLTVNASKSIDLNGVYFGADDVYPAGLFAQANSQASGRGGTLNIKTGRLSISNGARVQVATFGTASAGNLFIHASEIDVFETPRARYPYFAAAISGGALTTRETTKLPKGNGGSVNIFTNRLTVRDGGRVTTTTEGEGNAGTLQIRATDSVEVFGTTPGAQYRVPSEPPNSEISAAVASQSTGNGGSLSIDTGKLIIRDSGTVTVRNQGKGGTSQAGDSEITARSINLDKGTITATTNWGNGGDITLTLKDLLLLRNNSIISTTAGTAQQGGNGGNITINAPSGFIVSAPNENSNITANAFSGSGGRVTINATGIYGLKVFSREDLVRLLKTDDLTKIDFQQFPSSITAISQTSPTLNGQVNLNTPDVDINRGLVQLPVEVVDADRLINQNFCTVTAGTGSSFTVTGRGGIPSSPDTPAVSNFSWEDWRLLEASKQQQSGLTVRNTPISNTSSRISNQIVEAQGWVVDKDDSVILTAGYPVSLSQSSCS